MDRQRPSGSGSAGRRKRFRFAQRATPPESINQEAPVQLPHPVPSIQGPAPMETLQAELCDRPLVSDICCMPKVPSREGRATTFPHSIAQAVYGFDSPASTGFPLQLRCPNPNLRDRARAQYSIDSLLLTGAYSTEDHSRANFLWFMR